MLPLESLNDMCLINTTFIITVSSHFFCNQGTQYWNSLPIVINKNLYTLDIEIVQELKILLVFKPGAH